MNFYTTELGKDCVNLDVSLCQWLGERMVEWSKNINSYPYEYPNVHVWQEELLIHGSNLLEYTISDKLEDHKVALAKEALYFVAENLTNLWD